MASKLKNKFVAKSIPKLYLNSNTADVHFLFKTGDEIVKVPAHKAILAIMNPVFEAMFFGHLKENDIVEIVDASASAFEEFLQFFYLSEVSFTMENIETVVHLADKYDMIEFLNSCADFLVNQLTEDKILWGYRLAILINNCKLQQFCERQIKMITNEIFKTDAFLHCDKSVIQHILGLDSLHCREVDLFAACVEWARVSCKENGFEENDPENQKQQLDGCIQLIRFGGMTMDEIGTIMSKEQHKMLFTREELTDIICMKSDENFRSNVFKYTQRAVEWNSNKELKCDFKLNANSSTNVQSRESTWFSANIPALLGKIEFISVLQNSNSYNYSYNINSNIFIFEYNDQSFAKKNVTKRTLYAGTVNFKYGSTTPPISLSQPVIIHPKKMYEIHFDSSSTNTNGLQHKFESKQVVELAKGFLIKFHRHPSESDSRRGLVSVLHFNRI